MLGDVSSFGNKPDRTLSPGSMSETERRDLIARQRSALYGEGSFAETGGYIDETGTPRPGVPGPLHGPPGSSSQRGPSPLAYEYGRAPPPGAAADAAVSNDGGVTTASPSIGANPRSRANSTASPQPNLAGSDFQQQQQQASQASRTNNSSPGNSPINGKPGSSANQGSAVAPIGTRPSGSASSSAANPSLNKRSTTPLASPKGLGGGFPAPGSNGDNAPVSGSSSNPAATTPDGSMGVSGWGSRGGSVWGNSGKSGMGVQASVWG